MILTILTFLFLIIILHLYGKVCAQEIKLSLYIFSIFYIFYNYYPFFFLFLEKKNLLELGADTYVSIEPDFKLVITYIVSFFFLFCSGIVFTNFFFEKYIKFKFYSIKTNFVSYNYAAFTILITLLILFIYLYHDIISINYSYLENQKKNVGFFSLIKEIIVFFLAIIFFSKKRGNILFFIFLIFLITLAFLTKDKDWMIFVFVFIVTKIYLNNKKVVNANNFLIAFLGISFFLLYFLPFFSVFRSTNNMSYAFEAIFKDGYKTIGDPSSQLAISYLLINDLVSIKFHNILSNFTSFLPANLRLYDSDYAIKFVRELVGNKFELGQGFSFSILSEMILYGKKFSLYFYSLMVFILGSSYYFIIKLVTLIVPKNIKVFSIVFFSSFMSLAIVRSTLSGYLQFSFRYILVIFSIYCVHKLFSNLQKKIKHHIT